VFSALLLTLRYRPGTGKTVTIVEAIRQLLAKDPTHTIFACAPSNSAADLIAQRLTNTLGKEQLFRMNAYSRHTGTLPKPLLPFSLVDKDHFAVPPKETLMTYRVIVSTCFSASIPIGIGVPCGHFSHIFLDEAGQGTEPEIMISIKTMADRRTNVILSGDMKQLGPIVRSPVARELGLSTSYLDRLTSNPVYDEVQGHGKT
jgi:helicase MOV-10